MLSKSNGQILRVAAVMHALFQIHESELVVEDQISDNALQAAIDFVQTCISMLPTLPEDLLSQRKSRSLKQVHAFIRNFYSGHVYHCT